MLHKPQVCSAVGMQTGSLRNHARVHRMGLPIPLHSCILEDQGHIPCPCLGTEITIATPCGFSSDTRRCVVSGIDYASIGKRIRFYRLQLDLSQEEFASRIPVSRTYLSYLETGTRRLGLETLVRIANVLRVSSEVLLEDSLEETAESGNTLLLKSLLDCNPQETAIVMRSMNELIKILKDYSIK